MKAETTREHLEALAAGLCQDASAHLELASFWAWNPDTRAILVSAGDLANKGADYCAGVLAHEVGHYHISRYHLFAVDFPSRPVLAHLLNGIEDPRVNTWMRRRYPGTVPWFDRLRQDDAQTPCQRTLPAFFRFALEAAREELLGWQPASAVGPLPRPVEQALDQTRAARQHYATTLPAVDLEPPDEDLDLGNRYRQAVLPRLIGSAMLLPSRREQAVQISVLEALLVAERDVLPVATGLLDLDCNRLGNHLRELGIDPIRDGKKLCGKGSKELDDLLTAALEQETLPSSPVPELLRELALRLLEVWLRGQDVGTGRPGSPVLLPNPGGDASARSTRGTTGKLGQPLPELKGSEPAYEHIRLQVAGQIDGLVRHLEEVLQPRRRPRLRSGYPTGRRLDLRRVMAFEADPRLYQGLWQRPDLPQRRDAAFSLLVDLSGSMKGAKIEAACAGTVLLAETLHRVSVPFAIHGFQDVLLPFCRLGESFGPHARAALGEMAREVTGNRPGGNNQQRYNDDGPCLLKAAEDLLDWSAADHILIVISDGIPEGKHSSPDDLRRAVTKLRAAQQPTLIALGLGSGTDHVCDFYPEAVANIPPSRLADEIGATLRRHIG